MLTCLYCAEAPAGETSPLLDPTRPLAPVLPPSTAETSTPKPANLPRVSALFMGKGGGRAVIDGVLMKVGDTRNGLTLLSVTPGLARIQRDGESIDLPLLGSTIKKENRDRR